MYVYLDRRRQGKILEDSKMSLEQRQAKRMRSRSAVVNRKADMIEPITREPPKSSKYAHLNSVDKVGLINSNSIVHPSI